MSGLSVKAESSFSRAGAGLAAADGSPRRLLFVSCTGQDENIGDVVLRRRLLDELRDIGQQHVLLAGCGEGFIDALALGPDDKVYLNPAEWSAARDRAMAAGPIIYVAKPGEVQVEQRNVINALRQLPLMRRIVQGGGAIVQLGIGARSYPPMWTKALGATFHYHALVAWRDPVSQARFGFGDLMPDWGFDDAGPTREEMAESEVRDLLAISLRGDRPYPDKVWLDGVRAFADEAGLKPVIVTQVRRDSETGRRLATDLGGDFADWGDESHREQELRLRRLYRRSRLVLSDRLHVLILAFTELAIPLCYLDRNERKVGRHFDAVGYRKASVNISGLDRDGQLALLREAASRSEEVAAARLLARAQIRWMGERLRAVAGATGVPGKAKDAARAA